MTLLYDEMPCGTALPDEFPDLARAPVFATRRSILALDLGTYCGWAVAERSGVVAYGTEHFMNRRSWHPGVRWSNFRAWLSDLIANREVSIVYFEDVKAHGPGQVLAAHAFGGFLAMAQMVCQQHRVEMIGVPVGTVKKTWTGRGNAKKPEMIAAAKARGFRVAQGEDDTADALAILSLAISRENPR